jgi:hypothetical protein
LTKLILREGLGEKSIDLARPEMASKFGFDVSTHDNDGQLRSHFTHLPRDGWRAPLGHREIDEHAIERGIDTLEDPSGVSGPFGDQDVGANHLQHLAEGRSNQGVVVHHQHFQSVG